MDDQRLRVEIVAENRAVKDALMENLGSLKEALAGRISKLSSLMFLPAAGSFSIRVQRR